MFTYSETGTKLRFSEVIVKFKWENYKTVKCEKFILRGGTSRH